MDLCIGTSRRPLAAGLALATCLLLGGCDNMIQSSTRSTTQDAMQFSTVRVPGVSAQDARAVATDVFKEHFRVDPSASTATQLVSRPSESTAHADQESAGVREVLSGSSNRRRQIARLQLVERGADVLIRCHVEVQRLDVTERSAFAQQRAADDRPSNQTTDRRSGTQQVKDEDWSNVGRNRQLEREILDAIAERLAPVTGGASATQPGQ